PDGKFDNDVNRIDPDQGFLFMPGVRPFSPPKARILERLLSAHVPAASADSLAQQFQLAETAPAQLYTLPATDPKLPQHLFHLEALITGTDTEIILPQDIIEGSDVVKLDGQVLVRGTDYDIEPFAGGKITLKGDALRRVTPTSRIEVSYQFQ